MKHLLLPIALIALSAASVLAFDADEITRRTPEIGKHPNKEMMKALDQSPRELVALSLIKLTPDQLQKVEALKLDLERRGAEWEKVNGKRFAEVFETMKKLRFTPGDEAEKEHEKWHKMKCQMAQSRPRIDPADVSKMLTAEQLAAYQGNLATIHFWYEGHSENKRIMMLVEAGAKPQEAIALYETFSKQMDEYRKDSRHGEGKILQPEFNEVIKRVKAGAGDKN